MITFSTRDLLSNYVNNVRIEATEDNVFIDFGFADPFTQKKKEEINADIRDRVVMNISTFHIFAQHVADLDAKIKADKLPIGPVLLSRCPAQDGSVKSSTKKKS